MQVSRFTRRYALAAIAATLTVSAASVTLLAQAQINGAGATFPNPIYSKWFSEYAKIKPGVNINYQSLGSGAGIRQLTNQTVFFGATDGPMTADQMQAAPGKILHLPTVLGAVVPVYQLAGVSGRAEVHRSAARRHLPRQGRQVERSGDRQGQRRREAAGHRHHRGAPLGRVGHQLHLGRLPRQGVAGVEEERRRRRRPSSGRSAWAARATRAWPAWSSRRPARSATSSSSTPPEQDRLRRGAERRRRVRQGVDSGGHGGGRGGGEVDAGGFPRLDHQRAGRRRLSDLLVHLAAALREPEGQGPEQGDGGVHEVGADRRPEDGDRSRLRAAAGRGRQARDWRRWPPSRSRRTIMRSWLRGSDLGFKLGTGFFAAFLVVIVLGIGVRAVAAVDAVDREVRLRLLARRRSGIRCPASSGRAPSSGARSTRRCWRCCWPAPIALGIAIYLSELCPARLRTPLTFLTELLAAIPSIVYGLWGIFVLVPVVRSLRAVVPGVPARHAAVQRSRRSASACWRRC